MRPRAAPGDRTGTAGQHLECVCGNAGIFSKPSGVVDTAAAGEIYKQYKQGCDIGELMERFSRSRSSIYRIINVRRARMLLAKKIEFVASEEFLKDDAAEEILAKPLDIKKRFSGRSIKSFVLFGEHLLPEYLDS